MSGLNPCIVISSIQDNKCDCGLTHTHMGMCALTHMHGEGAFEMVEVKETHDDYIHMI